MPTQTQPSIPEKKEYTLLPEDVYTAKIHDIQDKERPVYNNPTETEIVYLFSFEISDGAQAGNKVFMNVTPSLFMGTQGLDPSNLYQIFCAVEKRTLDDEDVQGIDADEVNALIGKQLRITVKHKLTKEGDKRHKIDGFLPA